MWHKKKIFTSHETAPINSVSQKNQFPEEKYNYYQHD